MGEVYRARDTRLDRTVAIKVLPSSLVADPEVRQRFEREARAVAALNHPHICALYDVGHQDGIDYLVLEYLEGETLAARLQRGRLPTEELLRYGLQIAGALDKAHRQGFTHRDLKPGNIMLTKAGAKLLDFGLAKLGVGSRVLGVGETTLGTLGDLTKEGTILGTIQYMAPEQLEGKEADARSDLFSFGAVLYEMATGQKAFAGSSQASVIAAILDRHPPPIATLEPASPAAVDRLVRACLAKDRDERRQTARDVMLDLEWMAAGEPGAPARPVARNRERLVWMAATVVLFAGALAFAVAWFRRPPASSDLAPTAIRFSVPVPASGTASTPLSISPDGRRLVFRAPGPDSRPVLWVRTLHDLTAHALPGTEGAAGPFWSPDSRFLAFFAGGKLKKIEASSGPPQTLCDASSTAAYGTWNRDGVIVFAAGGGGGVLQRVAAAGGVPAPLTTLDATRQENIHTSPLFLPDGRHLLYVARAPTWAGTVFVTSLDAHRPKPILGLTGLFGGTRIGYAPSADPEKGHLLFVREDALMAQAFDARKLEFAGEPFPVVAEQMGVGLFSVSANGVLAYRPTSRVPLNQLAWFGRDGKPLGTVGPPGRYLRPSLSPDGTRLVVDQNAPESGANFDVWLIELARGAASRFTYDPSPDWAAVWSPDGCRIAFTSGRDRASRWNIYQKDSSGAGNDEPLFSSSDPKWPTDWSPDGRFLAYRVGDLGTKGDLWLLPLSGDRKPLPFVKTEFDEQQAQFSPDSRWIAYASDETSKFEVYVQPVPGGPSARAGKWQISTGGGSDPRWRRDGKELFFLSPDRKLMAVEVKAGPAFERSVPRLLFPLPPAGTGVGAYNSYAVTADGKRFLFVVPTEEAGPPPPITVVVNWNSRPGAEPRP